MPKSAFSLAASAALLLASLPSLASTGVCDSAPPASTQACIDAIQANGGVINDIFKDVNGLTATQLPVFGTLFNAWPGCDEVSHAGCYGQSNPPYDCAGAAGAYTCTGLANTFANASLHLNSLDRLWGHPCRLNSHALVGGCPIFTNNCIADGVGGAYLPWEGLVFDLGGPANKVAIFAQNDHGPQPCESTEYTVYLTDNPYSHSLVVDPKATGVDPMKWNRAVLTTLFTKGWVEVRPPDPVGHAACGDTALYGVEEDSFAQVFALPCGITFRYAAIIAGNDGLDFPECGFDSDEAELDAVAGLTESGAGVCPDADSDLFVDCMCPGAPPVCDCDDANPVVHPGALEACDSPDLSCDGIPGSCSADLVCYQSLCIQACGGGENPFCPAGATCTQTPQGQLCVPDDCTLGGCPPGGVCTNGVCVPVCDDVHCPGTQVCQDGKCKDPCEGSQCPANQVCQGGLCLSLCSCFAGDIGCQNLLGTVCDVGNTDLCVSPACFGVSCNPGQTCDPVTGLCVDFCSPDVKCPPFEKCVDPGGCVPLCSDVTCPSGLVCDPQTGGCVDLSCVGVNCFEPTVCVRGQCVDPTGSGGAGGGAATTGGAGGQGGAPGATEASSTGGTDVFASSDEGGCGCRVARSRDTTTQAFLAAAIAALAFARKRRKREKRRG